MGYEYTPQEGGYWTDLAVGSLSRDRILEQLLANRHDTDRAIKGSPRRSAVNGIEVFAVRFPDESIWDSELGRFDLSRKGY